jgi:hypothetical protein
MDPSNEVYSFCLTLLKDFILNQTYLGTAQAFHVDILILAQSFKRTRLPRSQAVSGKASETRDLNDELSQRKM